jgi:NADP-dependent 3-hydroxy acid dehydrogenase YdfG
MAPTVLITGASQGTGKATALLFAQQGYDIIMAARQVDRLTEVATQVQQMGRQALAMGTDVGNPEQVEHLCREALKVYGQIDVLINNAGICLSGPIQETSRQDWQRIMDTNFWGYVYTIEQLVPHFIARGKGAIVNVGSLGGKMPLPKMTAYCASKYAVTGLTETLRLELAPLGIQVCAIHPGVIKSDFMERAMFRGEDDTAVSGMREQMNRAIASSWASQPEEIAAAIWDALKQGKDEAIVGPAWMATEAYRLFPGAVQWAMSSQVKRS